MNFVLIRKKKRYVFYVTAVTVVTEENTLSTEIFGLPQAADTRRDLA